MKKLLAVLASAFLLATACIGFTACDLFGGNSGGNGHTSHDWSSSYTNGGDRHYQTCSGCDEKKYSDHDYGTGGVCVCGKTKPNEHTSHDWSTTCTNDGDRHYQTCSGCDEKKYSDHNYGTGGVCVCGKTKPQTSVAVTGVTLDKTELALEVDGSAKLTATVAPANATDKSVSWSSSKPAIAKVEEGTVTALAEGTAVITVTTANGKTATCTVTVTAPLTNAEVLQFLNKNVLLNAAKSIFPSSWTVNETKITNVTWYLTKDGNNITSANLLFTYLRSDESNYLNLYNLNFASPLTPQNIKDDEVGAINYTKIYQKIIDPQVQSARADLTNAICDKLFGAKENATRYIIDNGRNDLDSKLGDAKYFTVIEITDTEVIEEEISISFVNTDAGLIEKLANGNNYYTSNLKSHAITGKKLENNTAPF